MRKIISIGIVLYSLISYSQNNLQEIDSILKSVEQKNDSIWYTTYQKIGFNSIFSFRDIAPDIIKKGLKRALKKKNTYWETKFIYTYGVYKDVQGQFDSSLAYFEKTLTKAEKHNYPKLKISAVNGLGMNHRGRGNYEKALEYYFKALEQNNLTGEERFKGKFLGNIGTIYQEMSLFDKSLNYTKQALELDEKYKDLDGMVSRYNMLAILCFHKKDYKQAETYALAGLKLAKKRNMSTGNLDDTLSIIYMGKGDMNKAILLLKSLVANRENKVSPAGFKLQPIINLINSYNLINQPQNAKQYVDKGNAIISSNPEVNQMAENFYLNAADTYNLLRLPVEAQSLKDKGLHIKDSIFSAKAANSMAKLETKYNTAEKEREILIQRAKIAERDLVIQQRNYQLYGLGGFALILGLLGYLFYNQQKLKNQQLQKENELKDALIKIETQNKLQEQRLRISRDLHDNIGAQLTFIISSIDNLKYGFNIKDEKLTNKLTAISGFTSETIYELRDTIWAMNKNKISIEDLKTRITNYIDKAKTTTKTNFTFSVNEDIDSNQKFTSIKGMNIYRIIQEAIHNSLKYANASNISINLTKPITDIIFKISDDGDGYNVNKVEKGNGLINMEKRANHIQAHIQYKSEINKGTHVILIV